MDCNVAGAQVDAPGSDAFAAGSAPWALRPADASLCMTCPVRTTCIGALAAQAGTRQLNGVLAGWRRLKAGDVVVLPFPSLHAVRSGSLKSLLTGGEPSRPRGFHFAGEVVGAGGQPVRLVALEDTELCALHQDAACPPGSLVGRVWDLMSRELLRERAEANWLAALPPHRRVMAFLASVSLRVRAHGAPTRPYDLHLSAADIVGYLGVPAPTVGLVLAALAERGVLQAGHDQIGIVHPELLRREARC